MREKLINKKKTDTFYFDKINALRKSKKAIILAHFYQQAEIQDMADFIGDSLALSQKAAETDAEIIVFCGVKFMAETAKILSPSKKVLIPDIEAGCSLADSCTYEDLAALKKKYPEHKVVTYINSSARVKTLSDVVCTSSNAVNVVKSFPENQKLIFAPDKNLGHWVKEQTGREMVIWQGACEVHDMLKTESIIKLKELHTDAQLIAHPECKAVILEMADFVGSTTALLDFTVKSKNKKFIVATESGVLHQMKKNSPDKEFIVVPADETCSCNDCAYMKMITPKKLYQCLKNEIPEIKLSAQLIKKAKEPLLKMLSIK